ncbi:hypothetical protein HMPREF1989_01845 [Porphyromonas gingivalis F0566]|nr:hypothetical protein HMPREF1989_01845 [Porphyromonas gingivalis F0566]
MRVLYFSSIGKFIFQPWKIFFPTLEKLFSNLGKVIFQPWKKNRGI